jgi:hypothetical protein
MINELLISFQCRPETNGHKGNSAFYLSPMKTWTGIIWFSCIPYGLHSIEKTVSRMMSGGGYDGFFTNTSLRRTARTRLLESGVPDKVSRQIIGKQ